MTVPAAERWLQELADSADVDGETIHSSVTIDLDIASVLTITRRATSDERPQGIAIDADAPLDVAGRELTSVVLWSDSAPEQVELRAAPGRLTIWNVWRHDGAVHAWIGSAGLRRVELDDDTSDFAIRLVAFDGHGGRDPDLEFEVRIDGDRRARSSGD